ncbi:MAG: hypothetical protein K0R46_914 [Herbinix sp.]|jgi:hypothetical protein|nr:hypothetical protein [Herbinix sp.]
MKKGNVLPPNSQRVGLKTDPKINAEIRNQTIKNLNLFKNGNEADISERIRCLNQEWDTERVLAVKASLMIFLSSYLGIRISRMWFLVTGATSVFMLWHALLGWCPTLPIIRKWGVRTEAEINSEKIALKIIRGDFVAEGTTAADYLNMAEK